MQNLNQSLIRIDISSILSHLNRNSFFFLWAVMSGLCRTCISWRHAHHSKWKTHDNFMNLKIKTILIIWCWWWSWQCWCWSWRCWCWSWQCGWWCFRDAAEFLSSYRRSVKLVLSLQYSPTETFVRVVKKIVRVFKNL